MITSPDMGHVRHLQENPVAFWKTAMVSAFPQCGAASDPLSNSHHETSDYGRRLVPFEWGSGNVLQLSLA